VNWILDAGDWMLDAGDWMLDAGCWRLDAGDWRLDAGCWRLDAGWVERLSAFGGSLDCLEDWIHSFVIFIPNFHNAARQDASVLKM
jgi:hypothetical protein